MSRLQDVHLRGLASARPAATAVPHGAIYFSTDTQVLERSNGSAWETYSAAAAGGDVVGPASAVDQGIAIFDGTTGKLLKDSGVVVGSLAPKASPALTGTPTAPTAAADTSTTQIATTAYVQGELVDYAPLASPALTGTPTAPTAAVGTSTTQLATTAFATAAAAARASSVFAYSFSASTSAPPGANQIRFDAGSPYTAVTKVWIWNITSDGEDIYNGLRLLAAGTRLLVQDKNDHTAYVVFTVTGTPIDNTTYFEVPVSHLQHGSTALSGGQPVLLQAVGAASLGDVVGPASATNNAVAQFDGTTGKLIKDSATPLASLAPLASPTFTGTPAAPTASTGTATTQIATTAFVAAERLAPRVVALTDGATVALDAIARADRYKLIAAGDRTISAPTNPTDGQKLVIEHNASGANRTLTLDTGTGGFRFGSDITGLTVTLSGKSDYIGAIYSSSANKWDVVAYVKGY